MIGWPGFESFKQIVRNNLLQNNEITVEDIERAQGIFGTTTALLQGRKTAPSQIQFEYTTSVPDEMRLKHLKTKLYIDICYINKIHSLVTKSKNINFLTMNLLQDRKAETIIKHMKNILNAYNKKSFIVTDIFGDGEFDYEEYKIEFLPLTLQICSTKEHVPKIERQIQTIKEHSRSLCYLLLFRSLTKIMVSVLAKNSVQSINCGISKVYSPSILFEGKPNSDAVQKRIPF